MKFFDYFASLGFSSKEAEIYLALYRLGTQPASTVAKYAGMERTYVYKALLEFSAKNLVSVTEKRGVKHFFIPDISVLKKHIESEQARYRQMGEEFSSIEAELASYRQTAGSRLPKITIHEWSDGVRNLYEQAYAELIENGYISCRMFASNTIESYSGKADTIGRYADEFFRKAQQKNIRIETTLGNGLWLMESIGRTHDPEELRNLPAANESIQILLIGKTVYILIFKDIPFGIRFASAELAQALHFLLENTKSQ